MPYSHITRTSFGADAIAYAKGDGTGHNGATVRNEYTAAVNMLPDEVIPFEQQMRPYWERAHSRHTVQIDRCIVSFHPSELDPDKPEDCVKGLAIGREIAKRNAPDNQSAVFLQKDGKGGKIHLHILTNDVNISDCRGIDSQAYAHWHFERIVDEVCQQYFDLAQPEAQPERLNPSVRGSRMKNEQIRAANELERKRAAEEGREVDPEKIMAERYIWQDDLRQRVNDAAAKATDETDFSHQLRLSGVELVPPKGKDEEPLKDENGNIVYLHPATKKHPPHYTYELVDTTGFPDKIPKNLKAKSYKLGTNYQPETIATLFKAKPKENLEQEEAPPVVLEMPIPSPARKPAPKPVAATEKPSEDKEMEEAKSLAAYYTSIIMQQVYGWQEPKKMGSDGKKHIDFGEWDRQTKEKNDAFSQFTAWRVERRKELKKDGLKLSPIYEKDKITGHVSVLRADLETQFRDFLDRRDHPEKYAAQNRPKAQQPWEAPREQPVRQRPQEHHQEQDAPAKPSQAEQERQKIESQRSSLVAEMMRINVETDKRWKEQQASGEEDYDIP